MTLDIQKLYPKHSSLLLRYDKAMLL